MAKREKKLLEWIDVKQFKADYGDFLVFEGTSKFRGVNVFSVKLYYRYLIGTTGKHILIGEGYYNETENTLLFSRLLRVKIITGFKLVTQEILSIDDKYNFKDKEASVPKILLFTSLDGETRKNYLKRHREGLAKFREALPETINALNTYRYFDSISEIIPNSIDYKNALDSLKKHLLRCYRLSKKISYSCDSTLLDFFTRRGLPIDSNGWHKTNRDGSPKRNYFNPAHDWVLVKYKEKDTGWENPLPHIAEWLKKDNRWSFQMADDKKDPKYEYYKNVIVTEWKELG